MLGHSAQHKDFASTSIMVTQICKVYTCVCVFIMCYFIFIPLAIWLKKWMSTTTVPTPSSNLYVSVFISFSTDIWTIQTTTGDNPPALRGQTFTKIDCRRTVLFGGYSGIVFNNGAYLLDMDIWVGIYTIHVHVILNVMEQALACPTCLMQKARSKLTFLVCPHL